VSYLAQTNYQAAMPACDGMTVIYVQFAFDHPVDTSDCGRTSLPYFLGYPEGPAGGKPLAGLMAAWGSAALMPAWGSAALMPAWGSAALGANLLF
jgi:hypothetical protein